MAARAAGQAAMQFYGRSNHTDTKADRSPVTEADHASNKIIATQLHAAFPDDAILSEESEDNSNRLGHRRVWIVDPLDGTREFLSQNGEFSVMIALLEGEQLVLGVVYCPALDVLYYAAQGEGAFREANGATQRLRVQQPGSDVRVIGSRSHADPVLAALCVRNGYTDVVPCGSVGIKCARIAEGARDLYVHPVSYLGEWDTAAPEIILREAGGSVTDCTGNPLRYNKPVPRQPGILAAHPALVQTVLPTLNTLLAAS